MVTHTLKANNTEIHDGKYIVHPPLYCIQFNRESVCVINVWQLKVSPRLQRPVYYLRFEVLAKSHAAEGGGGARLCNTLHIKQAYLRRFELSKLKNVCLSKISQWWNDNVFYQKFLWLS